jgi:hypothetical protein
MTTVVQYVKLMRDTMADVSERFGVALDYEDKSLRAGLLSTLTVQAILVKALVDKGVISDDELLAALNAVRFSQWKPGALPVRPVVWDITPVTGLAVTGAPLVTGV